MTSPTDRLDQLKKELSDIKTDFSRRVNELERRIRFFEAHQEKPPHTEDPAAEPTPPDLPFPEPEIPEVQPETWAAPPETDQDIPGYIAPGFSPDKGPSYSEILLEKAKAFFTQGNVVVKVGVIVLFFGIGFLLKYAADKNMLPVELRLSFAGLIGIALLVVGFRLRSRRQLYATILQGAGVGVMYLTVFAAAKLFGLIPLALAFFIMIGIVAFSGLLAVIQDAASLAIFGIVGGFLSPILMSTGSGSHVALFSYYALLNGGIFGIAWFKSWRVLNWLGFMFTFIVGSLWGINDYTPDHFYTTEPFLILHFIFYAVISVLFAFRQPVQLKGYIDGTLVFGLPVVAFALQSGLVKDFEFGMALSALGAAAFYILLCLLLWKRKFEGMRMLSESFLALGTVFLSLAIPFALDSGWTSGIWAMEGVGIFWVGLRQNRRLARGFGILLQIAAACSFIVTALFAPVKDVPIFNAVFLSCLFISIAALTTHYFMIRFKWPEMAKSPWDKFALVPLLWGFLWWFGGGLNEIIEHVPNAYQMQVLIAFLAASGLLMNAISLKLTWKGLAWPGFVLPAVNLVLAGTGPFAGIHYPHPGYKWGLVSWILAVVCQFYILRTQEKSWNRSHTGYLHRATFYLVLLLISWEAAWHVSKFTPTATAWATAVWGVTPALMVLLLFKAGHRVAWPVKRFWKDYAEWGLGPVAVYFGIYSLGLCVNPGYTAPIPYLPFVNPVDLTQILVLFTLVKWTIVTRKTAKTDLEQMIIQYTRYLSGILAFAWLNCVIARSVHHWTSAPFNPSAMFDSVYFQASISILWTILSLAAMVTASRKSWRNIWFCGGSLLAVVVVKLFLIDLDEIGTVARIVTFMVAGGLMLVIGYFSPLPPAKKEAVQP